MSYDADEHGSYVRYVTTFKGGRGGWRGGGRPKKDPNGLTEALQIRVTEADKAAYFDLGGHDWFRKLLREEHAKAFPSEPIE